MLYVDGILKPRSDVDTKSTKSWTRFYLQFALETVEALEPL